MCIIENPLVMMERYFIYIVCCDAINQ